jgi:hypothetical protein
MFKVSSVLGCIPLRWGVLLIGLLGLAIQSSPIAYLDVIGLSNSPIYYIDAYEHGTYQFYYIIFISNFWWITVLENFIPSKFYFGIILFALIIVGILVNAILIAGVLKYRPKFLLPYIIFSWGELVFVIIYSTHQFLKKRISDDPGLILE